MIGAGKINEGYSMDIFEKSEENFGLDLQKK